MCVRWSELVGRVMAPLDIGGMERGWHRSGVAAGDAEDTYPEIRVREKRIT